MSDVVDSVCAWSRHVLSLSRYRSAEEVVLAEFFNRRNITDRLARLRTLAPAGHVVHYAPKNVDTTFAYVLLMSVLCGNTNSVRLTSNVGVQQRQKFLIDNINKHVGCDIDVKETFDEFDVRVIWGGNDTVDTIRQENPMPSYAREIVFHDKRSIAFLDGSTMHDDTSLDALVADITWADQQSCTSVKGIIWQGAEVSMTLTRVAPLTDCLAQHQLYLAEGLKTTWDKLSMVQAWCPNMESFVQHVSADHVGTLFHVMGAEVPRFDDHSLQTVVTNMMPTTIEGNHFDRVVTLGKSMKFDWVWDGYDLLAHLTREVKR